MERPVLHFFTVPVLLGVLVCALCRAGGEISVTHRPIAHITRRLHPSNIGFHLNSSILRSATYNVSDPEPQDHSARDLVGEVIAAIWGTQVQNATKQKDNAAESKIDVLGCIQAPAKTDGHDMTIGEAVQFAQDLMNNTNKNVFVAGRPIECAASVYPALGEKTVVWYWFAESTLGPNSIAATHDSSIDSHLEPNNVRDAFTLNAPGSYRIELHFAGSLMPAKTLSITVKSPDLFYENELRGEANFTPALPGECSHANTKRGLTVDNRTGGSCLTEDVSRTGPEAGDVAIEITAQVDHQGDEESAYGIIFASSKIERRVGSSYYALMVTGRGEYALAHIDSGSSTQLIPLSHEPKIHVGVGATNRLRVELEGTLIRCYINGGYVGGVNNPVKLYGGVGPVVQSNIRVTFSDLNLFRLHFSPLSPTPGRVFFNAELSREQPIPEFTDPSCHAWYQGAGYHVVNTTQSGHCLVPASTVLPFDSNVRIETRVALTRGPEANLLGVAFGDSGKGSSRVFYTFGIDVGGYYRLSVHTGSDVRALIDWTRDKIIDEQYGDFNRIAVEIRGATIYCFVNGKEVGSANAPSVVRGNVGLYVSAPGMEAVYASLRLSEL